MQESDGFGHVSIIVFMALGIFALALWMLPPDAGPVVGQESGEEDEDAKKKEEDPLCSDPDYWDIPECWTPTPTYTPVPPPTPTYTPVPTPTDTPVPTPTDTPVPTPTDTPVPDPPTSTPTPRPPDVYATISRSDDDLTVSFGWTSPQSQSTEWWSIALLRSATRNGSYTTYRSTTRSNTGSVSFSNVSRGYWYMASVTGCDEDNVCASVNTSKIEVPPPTPAPTPTPTPVLSVSATISVTDDDVKITYGWKPGGSSQSSETWAITLRQSTARNGTYTNYSSASSPAAGTARFDNVPRNRWYMARVSGCDEHSNCASANTGKLKVETPTPVPTTPPPPTPTPSGKLTATPTTIERFATTKVTATDLSPSNLYFRIEYPDTLQLGTNCSTRGTGKRYTTKFTTTTNFTFSGCKYGVHTLKLLTETGTTALATAAITVATPTPTPVPAGPSFATTTAIHHAYHKDVSVNTQLPAATGGVEPLKYTITPSMKNSLSFSTTTRTVSGTPGEAATTGTYTYKVTDAKGRTAQREFKVTVFNLEFKLFRDQAYRHPAGLHWWQVMYVTRANFTDLSGIRTPDLMFQARVHANSGYQLENIKEYEPRCEWTSGNATSTEAFESNWTRQHPTFPYFAFYMLRCDLGTASTLRLEAFVRQGEYGTAYKLHGIDYKVPPAHHHEDNRLTYYVRGTYFDSVLNEFTIRGKDAPGREGMFPPLPSNFTHPKVGTTTLPVPNSALLSLMTYSDTAAVWNGVGANIEIASTTSPSGVDKMIRGYWDQNSYTGKPQRGGCDPRTIACVDESDFKTMWIEDPPRRGGDRAKQWAPTYASYNRNSKRFEFLPDVIIHEFGHFLGLGHPYDQTSVMSGRKPDEECQLDISKCLGRVDKEALKLIYP